jgi:transcriptional regulator with XRE-family HTH domain
VKKTPKRKRVLIYDEEGLKLLAEQLKKVRVKKNFTQESLAYEAEITLSQIARIETAKINPTVSTIFKLARALQVPVSDLFDFKLSKQS